MASDTTVLVVDDDPVQRRLVEAALHRGGYRVRTAEGGAQALAALAAEDGGGALMILDLAMPGGPDGLAVLDAMRQRGLRMPVIVQTAQGGIDTVVAAMRAGAFDFVVKPASPEKIVAAVGRALKAEATGGAATERAPKPRPPSLGDFAAAGLAMGHVARLARKAAASAIPVLIEGESGSGKEVLARAIRDGGERRAGPFVTVNCGAIPEHLVESILFGHEKGAFTGATERHAGKFAEAHGGTLFLDEVGDLPLDAQVKLLRAVQEGEVDPVGGRGSVKVDIRLISATHRDLLERVEDGRFREDLFYRLHVFPIRLPPLRERRDEIPGLVARFIGRVGGARGPRVSGITPGALALLQAHDWPGNIRELENAVFRACVLSEGGLLGESEFPQIAAQVAHAPRAAAPEAAALRAAQGERGESLGTLDASGEVRSLAEVEAGMIRFAVERYRGRMSEVARRLGIGRSTLYRKLRELGIDSGEARGAEHGLDEAAE